ncbi:MAG: MinD/ParA family protein [Deltaproteobacteria bacterium]|nr:MinD/ParA family protein [Deltaproteobacteria bacterium]MCB9787820.1 MinD/ParA family protein [Deltaproteobacteria bacterium]
MSHPSKPGPLRALRVIAVTSGKGGVGKTSLTVNLALTFARQGRRVLIIDGDTGLANVDILLDVQPRATLRHLLSGQASLDEVLLESEHGVTILPGSSGVAELSELSAGSQRDLLEAVDVLGERFDTVLVDTAAGIGSNARFFAGAAQEVLVVATPEPTSLADAYAMIKVLSRRCGVRSVGVVLNQVVGRDEARDVFERLESLCARFLPVALDFVGTIPRDPHVREAVMAQLPLVTAYPACPASQAITRLADDILSRPAPTGPDGRLQLFWTRLLADAADASRAEARGSV